MATHILSLVTMMTATESPRLLISTPKSTHTLSLSHTHTHTHTHKHISSLYSDDCNGKPPLVDLDTKIYKKVAGLDKMLGADGVFVSHICMYIRCVCATNMYIYMDLDTKLLGADGVFVSHICMYIWCVCATNMYIYIDLDTKLLGADGVFVSHICMFIRCVCATNMYIYIDLDTKICKKIARLFKMLEEVFLCDIYFV